jgi:ribosome-binding factor A
MPGRRLDRLNEQVKREVADILRLKVKDPRIGAVTVTDARVSRDLSVATIHVLLTGQAAEQRETLQGLQAAAPFVRSELGQRLRLRKLPTVRFLRDESWETAQRIERLLHEVKTSTPSDPDAQPDDD